MKIKHFPLSRCILTFGFLLGLAECFSQAIYNAEPEASPVVTVNPQLQQKFYINSKGEKTYFLVYQPETPLPGKKYKLILYFGHSGQPSGASQNYLSNMAKSSLMKVINDNSWAPGNGFQNNNFVVVAPQVCYCNYPSGGFTPAITNENINMAVSNFQIDEDHIYLWGGSAGDIGLNNYVAGSEANSSTPNECYAGRIAAVYENLSEGGNTNPPQLCTTWAKNHVALWEEYTIGDGAGALSASINSCSNTNPVAIVSTSLLETNTHFFYGATALARGNKISKAVPNPLPGPIPPANTPAWDAWTNQRDNINPYVGVKTQNYWNPGFASVPDYDPSNTIDIFTWFSLQSKSLVLNNQNFRYPSGSILNTYTQGSVIEKYNTIIITGISNLKAVISAKKWASVKPNTTILPGTTLNINSYCSTGTISRMGDIKESEAVSSAHSTARLLKFNPVATTAVLNSVIDQLTPVSIFNAQGILIKDFELPNGQTEIDVSDLPEGIYIIRTLVKSSATTEKLVIVK